MNAQKFHDYDAFVDKFVPKKTTDDCYTPQPVYDAVLDFVARTWGLAPDTPITRPFWPGGDYQAYDYPDGCIVVDNPPFSILSQIIRHYCARGIRFFLFAPGLTLFTARDCDLTYIVASSSIKYANGANVKTGFITNLPSDLRVWCCPELMDAIDIAQAEPVKAKRGFVYPDNLITAATLQTLTTHHTEFRVRKADCVAVNGIDNAKRGRDIFGGGFLLSTRAAAERAAAERAAAERIQLSIRERRLIQKLDRQAVKLT